MDPPNRNDGLESRVATPGEHLSPPVGIKAATGIMGEINGVNPSAFRVVIRFAGTMRRVPDRPVRPLGTTRRHPVHLGFEGDQARGEPPPASAMSDHSSVPDHNDIHHTGVQLLRLAYVASSAPPQILGNRWSS